MLIFHGGDAEGKSMLVEIPGLDNCLGSLVGIFVLFFCYLSLV